MSYHLLALRRQHRVDKMSHVCVKIISLLIIIINSLIIIIIIIIIIITITIIIILYRSVYRSVFFLHDQVD